MAVKVAKAFGMHVTVLSSSLGKREEALSVLGADAFVVTKDEEDVKVRETSTAHSLLILHKGVPFKSSTCQGWSHDSTDVCVTFVNGRRLP